MSCIKKTTETGYAKINLALDVIGKLPNGYHEVRMIMESIGISDEIEIVLTDIDSSNPTAKPGIRMTCNIESLSCGDDNLVVKAAKAICEAGQIDTDSFSIDISLVKRIPMAAGLAGGSTDAAAVLKGLNKLLDLNFTTDKLCEIGVKLGADIPYCIRGGSMLSEGIGEVLSILPSMPKTHIVVIKPPIDVSTKYVYEHIDAAASIDHPDIDGMILAMSDKNLNGIASLLGNVLEDVTVNDYPIISEIKSFLVANGALGSLMSGSGPTIFGLFDSEETAQTAFEKALKQYSDMQIFITSFV